MMKDLNIKIISDLRVLEAMKPVWNNLLADSPTDVIQLRHEWFVAGLKCYGQSCRLHVVQVRDRENKTLAIAPLVIVTEPYRGLGIRKLKFAGNPQTPYNSLIIRNGSESEAWPVIADELLSFRDWDLVDFDKISQDAWAAKQLDKAVEAGGYHHGVKENIESPFVVIDGDWDRFLANRSVKFRKSMRNKINRAEKAGNLVIDELPIETGSHPALDDMFRVSGKSWKHEVGNDLSSLPSSQQFYREICDCFGPQGWVSLWLMTSSGTPIAFEFHLSYHGVKYPIRADYDADFAHFSPGSVLEFTILKNLFEDQRTKEYNSCGHNYHYLLNWSKNTRRHINVEVFNRSPKMEILFAVEYRLLPLLRKLRLNDFYHSLKRFKRYANT